MQSLIEQLIQEALAEEERQLQQQHQQAPAQPSIELPEELDDAIESMSTEEMIGALKMLDILVDYFQAQQQKKQTAQKDYRKTLDGFRTLVNSEFEQRNQELKSGNYIENDVQKIIADRSGSAKYSSYTGRRDGC
jgi:hypothetical protein